MSDFPRSVTLALKTSSDPVVYTRDDDLGQAEADYHAALTLWRNRNGKDGGIEAFRLLAVAAQRLVALRQAALGEAER